MARRRSGTASRRRDDTWVVKEDEFHPNPQVAAVAADENARDASLRQVKADLTRIDKQIANETLDPAQRRILREERRALIIWRQEIETEIAEKAKEKEEARA